MLLKRCANCAVTNSALRGSASAVLLQCYAGSNDKLVETVPKSALRGSAMLQK